MDVKKLEIKLYEFCRPGKNVSGMQFYHRADFLVDGKPLSHAFVPLMENPHSVSTQLDKIPPSKDVIEHFSGSSHNKSSTLNRFVLYQVADSVEEKSKTISCVVEREGRHIVWKDIRSEGLDFDVNYSDLRFDLDDYQDELKGFIARNPVTRT